MIAAQGEALQETAADLRRRAEEYAGMLGVSVTFIATRGDPYTELRRVADEVRANAVIVGASAKAGHRWVGSLAVRLVKAGRWPVTVVPWPRRANHERSRRHRGGFRARPDHRQDPARRGLAGGAGGPARGIAGRDREGG